MKYLSVLLILLVVICSCHKKKVNILTSNIVFYEVNASGDSYFQWDDLIDTVEFIQLELTDESAIGRFSSCFIDQDGIFVFDGFYYHLFHFDTSGKFIREIGKRGQGPGEFLEMRDVCITGNLVYTLDYKKVHCYDKLTGQHVESWTFKNENGFNPSNLVVFDKDNYYLFNCCPDVMNKNEGEYYHMQEMRNGRIKTEFFKYEFDDVTANQRFFPYGDNSYYVRPFDGEDIVYTLTPDSLYASFGIDFGNMALTKNKIKELNESKDRNAILKSNTFKNVDCILEVKDLIYFSCSGPSSRMYEGIIKKQTGETRIGKYHNKRTPIFLFSDGTCLYGYYSPAVIDIYKEDEGAMNKCFEVINNLNVNIEDNFIIAKIHLK